MNKTAIKTFAIEARKKLIASVKDKAGLLGITSEGCRKPEQKGEGFEVYRTHAETENEIFGKQIKQRESLVNRIKEKGYENVMEEVAYTWFNRIIAIRFMEVNGYLPTRVRVLSSETENKIEPDIVTQAPDVDLDFTDSEKETIYTLKAQNKLDELFFMLFIKQCNKLGEILPELFEKVSDYKELLLNVSYTNQDGVIRLLVDSIEEKDFKEAVEIIGWMYQYYNDERKNEVINIYKGIVKKEEIPAATQLFTTDWVVRYMVDNSLGRYWIERHPESNLKDKLKFYIEDSKKNEDNPIKIEINNENNSVEQIKLIDPCMGSGHILIYAFDVFMEIYRECGYSERDAARLIIEKNIYGLEIDDRAYQLAYFAVMMKGREFDRRLFTRGIMTNLCSIQESNSINTFEQGAGQQNFNDSYKETANYLIDIFKDAKEYGSIINVEQLDYDGLLSYIKELEHSGAEDLFMSAWLNKISEILPALIKQAKILSMKYEAVVTNPPYLNKMDDKLKKFVTREYKDYSGDLFSVFMYRNFDLCKPYGYSAFMSPFVWMFIKTYENLRKYIVKQKSIISLIQMEYSAFEEATVPICTFVLKNSHDEQNGLYIKLSDFKGGMDVQKSKVLEAITDKNCGYFYETRSECFIKVPGIPIAYWVSKSIINVFGHEDIYKYSVSPSQNVTGNNNKYLRYFWEVNNNNVGRNKKWIFYAKGGGYRKWYGNMIDVINWTPEAREEYRTGHGSQIIPEEYWYKKGITWGLITSNIPSFRLLPVDTTFDKGGSSIFIKDDDKYNYILGLLNSVVFLSIVKILNPTLNFQVKDIRSMPIIIDNKINKINEIVNKVLYISQNDWDSFETSWDFKKHSFLTYRSDDGMNKNKIEFCYRAWDMETTKNFEQLKSNEEELNRIFIEIYGLQDELTPEVEDKDITIRKADSGRDIRSFISYAVGCMFGRYSPDTDGLAYAGGSWDEAVNSNKFKSFIPDKDNIIPITDEEYFEDDIVGLFVKFVKTVYGEGTLEENLDFIAKALGNKGVSSREIIRNYFIKDFYKDHLKVYQKRPIYWQFDSGKENGFKALIYIHRYDKDTVGRVRADYLHRTQTAIENAIKSSDYIIETTSNNIEKAKSAKAREKYIKQLAETRTYDEAMAHIAHQRIEIDSDDGVKVNYAKFQGVEISREGKKAQTIDLLTKI